jgi:hypothetical protein
MVYDHNMPATDCAELPAWDQALVLAARALRGEYGFLSGPPRGTNGAQGVRPAEAVEKLLSRHGLRAFPQLGRATRTGETTSTGHYPRQERTTGMDEMRVSIIGWASKDGSVSGS